MNKIIKQKRTPLHVIRQNCTRIDIHDSSVEIYYLLRITLVFGFTLEWDSKYKEVIGFSSLGSLFRLGFCHNQEDFLEFARSLVDFDNEHYNLYDYV